MVKMLTNAEDSGTSTVWGRMARTKKLPSNVMDTPLKRCLTTLDITLLGIGHMVGAGIYVLCGTVAKNTAGPAVIVSFLIAGFVSILSALCYAEFGARVPKAGSCYVYTYVSIGEFWAFVIGWNMILEYMIGAASVSRAWSGYIDSLFDGAISNFTINHIGSIHEDFLAPYLDPVAFLVTLIYCSLLSFGAKASTYFNSAFTVVNMGIVALIIGAGIYCSDIDNWKTSGGFAPFGFSGIIAGAATTFFAFVGFDSIATSSEEALNPKKSVPLATIASMTFVTIAYGLISAVLTLMVPYYDLNPASAIPDAFAANGLYWAKYVVSIGALCGMTTSLFGSLFSLPRCLYAMATDGLMFSCFAKVNEKTQVPIVNILICGLFTAVISLVFDIEKLVEFMSIGTLMAYTIVSACVIILRYAPVQSYTAQETLAKDPEAISSTASADIDKDEVKAFSEEEKLLPLFRWMGRFIPNQLEERIVSLSVVVFTLSVAALFAMLMWGRKFIFESVTTWAIILVIILLFLMLTSIIVIAGHRQVDANLTFKVPFVPYLPLLSIFCNVALMVNLNPMTWLRFAVWMIIGLLIYFSYGLRHSKLGKSDKSLFNSDTPRENVYGTAHRKLSQVSWKIAPPFNGSVLKSKESLPASTEYEPHTKRKFSGYEPE